MSALILRFPTLPPYVGRTKDQETSARLEALTAILQTALDGVPREFPNLAPHVEAKARKLAAKFVARFDEAKAAQP